MHLMKFLINFNLIYHLRNMNYYLTYEKCFYKLLLVLRAEKNQSCSRLNHELKEYRRVIVCDG